MKDYEIRKDLYKEKKNVCMSKFAENSGKQFENSTRLIYFSHSFQNPKH